MCVIHCRNGCTDMLYYCVIFVILNKKKKKRRKKDQKKKKKKKILYDTGITGAYTENSEKMRCFSAVLLHNPLRTEVASGLP